LPTDLIRSQRSDALTARSGLRDSKPIQARAEIGGPVIKGLLGV